jgi:lysyl-tRNA synthetase, class II
MSEIKAEAGSQRAEESLIEARRKKATLVRARGADPFANDVAGDERTTLDTIRRRFLSALLPEGERKYDAEKVTILDGEDGTPVYRVFGRLLARRGFGKASFLELRDRSEQLQLFAKADEMGAAFAALEEIDLGDHVEATGTVTVTKTGELSLLLRTLRLLSKAIRPLPDKWHGLVDVETRYRQRYVDLVANPDVVVAMRARSIIVQALRDFLDQRDFVEVETPTLHQVVGGAAAQPFVTHHNALDLNLFLRIAPELYLKRLLVGGLERVYELARCYRNEGISTRHNPEFTMLEFYQAYATYETLMPMTEALFRHVDESLARRLGELGMASQYETWQSARGFTLNEPFVRVPMRQAAASALVRAGLDADVVLGSLARIARKDPPDGAADALVGTWAKTSERSRKVDWGNLRNALSRSETDGERLFVAYEYLAEPFLTQDYRSADGKYSLPVFILDYPAEVSPLARRKNADPTLTDRFELFVDGIERCNAFSELNDPDDQAERFRGQVEKKSRGAAETMDYDADYIRALEHGMPPAAGFGLGVDRLCMMLTGQASIRDVILFPLLRPEANSA